MKKQSQKRRKQACRPDKLPREKKRLHLRSKKPEATCRASKQSAAEPAAGTAAADIIALHSSAEGPPTRRRAGRSGPGLKGSIGEGPNHSNHSNHSNSFKLGIFGLFFPRKFKISENFRKFQHFLNYRRTSDKISSKSK